MKRTSPLRRSGPLARQSPKRKRESRIYAKLRAEFMAANPWCQLWVELWANREQELMRAIWPTSQLFLTQRSSECHHRAGRHSGNYLNVATWMALSTEAHRWVTDHPKEAEARGWIIR